MEENQRIQFYLKSARDNLSQDFSLGEAHCKCKYDDCIFTLIDSELVKQLQKLRTAIGVPISINCLFRCQKHNKDVGGVPKSQHLMGCGADISCSEIPLDKLHQHCCLIFNGVIRYDTFLHVDMRPQINFRLDKRTKK